MSRRLVRCRENPLCLEDRLHGLPRDTRVAELAKLSQNAGVVPAVLASEPQDEFANTTGSAGTPGSIRRLVVSDEYCFHLSHPPAKSVITHD